jgi:pyrroline-5-carboxylate reductase
VLGIVGVGAIAEAIIIGLCEGEDTPASIHLSPRSAERSSRLAARYPSVEVLESNQAVVDRADVVLVCVRPQDGPAVLAELAFRAEQAVISVMAGIQIDALRPVVAPAEVLLRAIPLPAVARRDIDTINRWLANRGIPQSDATRYVAAVFGGLSGTLRAAQTDDFGTPAGEYATPGGTNEQFLAALRRAGTFDDVEHALDDVAHRLEGEG